MLARACEPVELRAILKSHRNAPAARTPHNFLDAFAMPPAGDDDAVEGAARLESFFHRVNSRKTVHEFLFPFG
jgi:hypothetical protein